MSAPDAPSIPATASPDETRRALAEGAVMRWWQTTAFLVASGAEAATLLDGLCTQAVERIEPGHAVPGLFLDAKAKIIAPVILHRTTPETFLLETLPELVGPLASHLKKYRLRAKVTIEPSELATIALVGEQLPQVSSTDGAWSRVTGLLRPALALIAGPDACADVVRAGAPPLADPDAFEADRIERGIASLHDLLPGRMPAEVGGMDTAVALDAGCYLGQEPVARLHYRGKANRSLRRLAADGPIAPGAPLPDDEHLALYRDGQLEGRPPGRLTTWARSGEGTVALAMLRREVTAGSELALPGSDALLRVVDDAPA
jgi:folate-binding protein YgfZ